LEDFPHALSAYLNYSRICPDAGNDASYLYGLGLVYFAFGEYNWSALSFQKVLSQCPDFGRLGEVHIRLAIIHKDNGNLMKSIDHFSKAYGINGTSSMTKLEIQFHIGHLHYLRGDCGGAKLCFEAILASKNIPNHIKALTLRQLGWLYHTVPHIFSFSNPSLKAIELLKLAVGANPQCPLSWYLLGRCHSSLGQSKEAFMSYRQSISKHEKQPDTWCAIGILYHQMGQARDSLQAYITALYFDINHTAGWIDLGLLYESCGHLIDGLLCYKNGLSSINKRHTSSSPSSSSDDITNLLLNRHNYVEQYVNQTGGVAFYSAHPRSTLPSLQESWNTLIPDSLRVKYPSTQTPILCLPSSPVPPSPLLSPLTGRSSNKRYKTQKSKVQKLPHTITLYSITLSIFHYSLMMENVNISENF
jgi:histone demethylase